jgi:hypothetical protein
MTRVSRSRRTRILPPSPIPASEKNRRTEQSDALANQCSEIFERLHPQLIEDYENWHIAIDPDTEQYLLAPTLDEIIQKVSSIYGNTGEVKVTIFRLNDTGSCGRLWV